MPTTFSALSDERACTDDDDDFNVNANANVDSKINSTRTSDDNVIRRGVVVDCSTSTTY
jgi:hypothetical protein